MIVDEGEGDTEPRQMEEDRSTDDAERHDRAKHDGLWQKQEDGRDQFRDAASDEVEIGKPVGRDLALGRPSAVIELGLDGALYRLHELVRGAIDAMPPCPNGAELRSLMLSEAKRLVPAKLAQFAA